MPDNSEHDFNTTELDPDLLSTPFRVRTNWHVITGAQSSGKTTLIGQLADEGSQTAPETARQYFEREMDKERTMEEITENMVALERGIETMQLRMERGLRPTDVVFLDRAFPDSLTFLRVTGLNPNEILAQCFHHRYASVFVLDQLPFEQGGLREEVDVSADLLDEWLPRDYCAWGYSVVRVPVLSPQERLTYVLERLSERGLA